MPERPLLIEMGCYHKATLHTWAPLQTEAATENLTKPSKVAIGIAELFALVCVAALILILAREAPSLTENGNDEPAHEPVISDNLIF